MESGSPERYREVLAADLAIQNGEDAASVGDALSRYWETGDPGSMADIRARVADELEAALDKAGGDAHRAVASRGGLDRTLLLSVPALSGIGPGARTTLREVDPDRYVGFEKLGAGGMGVVYLALDTELNRSVALKLVGTESRSGPLGEETEPVPDDWIARFLQEARVTGGLEHPGIVPVHEVGKTPSGKPYYTMRVVRGRRTLRHAIRDARNLENRLALLEPFLKACDTMHYAHSRGVIHRDLKPSNIALGEFGEVVVLDWGLAKVKDLPDQAQERWRERMEQLRSESGFATWGAVGTPGYMSPESLGSDLSSVGERSDVYSLGVTLYEALTGRLPHGETGLLRRLDDLAAVSPPPPDEMDPAVPARLSRICGKALAIDPTERYASAGDLAEDIRSWQRESAVERELISLLAAAEGGLSSAQRMEGEALQGQIDRVLALTARILQLSPGHAEAIRIDEEARARRDAALAERERAGRRRLLRRVAVVGLALATAAAVLVAVLLDRKRREAEDARSNEASARRRAEEERTRAEDISDFMLVDLRDKLEPLGRLDLLGAVARRSLRYQRSLPSDGLTAEDLRERGVAFGNLGDVLSDGGDLDAALDSYREGLAIARRLAASAPDDPVFQRDLAVDLERVGDALLARGDVEAAHEAFEESLGIKLRLVELHPEDTELSRDLAQGHDRIARIAWICGDAEAALRSFEKGLRIREAHHRADLENADWQREVALGLNDVARIHAARGDRATALRGYERSLGIRRRLAAAEPKDFGHQRDLVVALIAIGALRLEDGDAEAALASFREGLRITTRLVAHDPTNAVWQRDRSVALDRIGDVHAGRGELDAALGRYRESLDVRTRLADADPANTTRQRDLEVCHDMIGRIHKARGDPAAAVECFGRALGIAKHLAAADPENVLLARDVYVTLASLAGAHELAGDRERCSAALQEAVERCEAVVARAPHLDGELEQLRAAYEESRRPAAEPQPEDR